MAKIRTNSIVNCNIINLKCVIFFLENVVMFMSGLRPFEDTTDSKGIVGGWGVGGGGQENERPWERCCLLPFLLEKCLLTRTHSRSPEVFGVSLVFP